MGCPELVAAARRALLRTRHWPVARCCASSPANHVDVRRHASHPSLLNSTVHVSGTRFVAPIPIPIPNHQTAPAQRGMHLQREDSHHIIAQQKPSPSSLPPPPAPPSTAQPTAMPPPFSSLSALPASSLRLPGAAVASSASTPDRPNLWSVLKESVGKDLTRIALPVFFNEPLSFLQRLAEDVEYYRLLDAAAATEGPDRAALVAAFVISHYSSTAHRPSKPFNPLLGESYDLVIPAKLALVAEQVAHHPPTSAVHVAGNGWTYHTAHEIKNRFKGNSLEVWPEGPVHLRFHDGDHFVYEQARTYVHNIILGELWLDNVGTITIRQVSNPVSNPATVTTLKLKKTAFLFGEADKVGEFSGRVATPGKDGKPGKTLKKLTGNWNSEVRVDGKVVWTATLRPPKSQTAGHNMTAWAWMLNAELEKAPPGRDVPKTDSRLRPDQRALEQGQYRLAAAEKERLEHAQRKKRRDGESEQPKWFELAEEPGTGRKEWKYRGGYFECKRNQAWPENLPDIF